VALEQMIDRLHEDHDNAQILARGIAEIPGLSLDPRTVQTNIVFFDLVSRRITTDQFVQALHDAGVWVLALGPGRVRAVTHYGIEKAHVEDALQVIRQVMAGQA